jgi:hypothetical protein
VLLSIYETSKKKKQKFMEIVGEKLGVSPSERSANNSTS